jgi:hypothetical protein
MGIYGLFGVWALAILAIFIWAVRQSYKIEARSPDLHNKSGFPRKAMLLHTVTNWKVARDDQTQARRRRMNLLLVVVLGGFVLMGLAIRWVR